MKGPATKGSEKGGKNKGKGKGKDEVDNSSKEEVIMGEVSFCLVFCVF